MSFYPKSIGSHQMDYTYRFRYETLRSLLNKNGDALQILSDLEADLNHMRHYDKRIKRPLQRLVTEALLMAQELNLLTGKRYLDLYTILFKLRNEIDQTFVAEESTGARPLALMMKNLEHPDPILIGGKAAGVWRLEKSFGDSTPSGFVVTTAAYNLILTKNNLYNRIRILLNNLDVTTDQDQFMTRTQTIRRWISEAEVPEEVETAIKTYAGLISETDHSGSWAVRSSAVFEDGVHSFAGQFDSELSVGKDGLTQAYLRVLASRFSDRAVKYRIHTGFREVDTPMAVLFMPMVDPAAAGAIYTSDIENPAANTMVINAVPGLADKMIRGEVQADTFHISKDSEPKLLRKIPATINGDTNYLNGDKLLELARMALKATETFGHEMDMEWALDKTGNIRLLQARKLNIALPSEEAMEKSARRKDILPIVAGGITIFPGRAEGPVKFLGKNADLSNVPEGCVVVVEKPEPELAFILPKIAALLVMEGNPVGHLATLVREFSVPCIFKLGQNAKNLLGENVVSVNATKRSVYSGVRWPGIRERVLARIASENRQSISGPLYDRVLKLNLLDPDASSFKAKSCQSVHDTLRFMHEMAVRSMFGFGDAQKRAGKRKSRKLKTDLPIKFQLIDLDTSIPPDIKTVEPEQVESIPFKALWRGMSDKRLSWPDRWEKEMRGMPSDFREAVLGGNKGPRRVTDTNYAIIAKDYLNLNARFAYHYSMVDAMVGPGTENNHVHFRLRGGGAGDDNKVRRTRFLELVLRQSGFGVDRKKDLITAWLRRYPQKESEAGLELLGRLIVCARQLDAVLRRDGDIKLYAEYFQKEKFEIFS